MAFYVAREGVWDVAAGTTSSTPALTVTGLRAGTHLKVTVHFTAQTDLAEADHGFYYSLSAAGDNDVLAVTPTTAAFQGAAGWQSCTLISLFEVLASTDGATTFECRFSKGDLSGTGSLMNFLLLAEVV